MDELPQGVQAFVRYLKKMDAAEEGFRPDDGAPLHHVDRIYLTDLPTLGDLRVLVDWIERQRCV